MRKAKILLVDDEINVLKSIVRLLNREGMEVMAVERAPQALKLMEEHDFHLVISDLRMPEMDGIEFLTIVTELYPKTLQILISGHAEKPHLEQAINQCQIRHFMTKPWEVEELKSVTTQLLEEAEYMRMSL